ncbi:MAG: site-specific DNA-methyltransferase [Candidatus Glassbacteria bacterium]|nr:site-specific DNA-methyltransferase [Candidatus Glassbacteria bacterium]
MNQLVLGFIKTRGLLIHGDNYDVLRELKRIPEISGKIRLVYIDPPFGTNQNFNITDTRVSTISRVNGGRVAYSDNLTGEEYLKFLAERLVLIREIMADHGSIYVHIDTKMGHYVKCCLDNIFGQENFINDITRIKCNPKNFNRKGYGNYKDVILFYAKTRDFIWNHPRQAIDTELDPRFKNIDEEGRRYTTTPLHAPGETQNGVTGKPWRGIKPPPGRHWRYPPEKLEELERKGLIEWSSNQNPRKILYADEVAKAGVKMQDVWKYKDPQNPKYPTEKNLEMLKMIIKASSNEGDIILDAFCGSGTALVAAQELGRSYIGIDSSVDAVEIARKRLKEHHFLFFNSDFQAVEYERMVNKNA